MDSAEKKEPPKAPWRVPTWFGDLTPESLKKLQCYNDELLRFNKTISLVSTSTADKVDLVHFADSILGWRTIKPVFSGSVIYDIGSGNGFDQLDSNDRISTQLKKIIFYADLFNI